MSYSQNANYGSYYRNVNEAEYKIFVLNDSIKGLEQFRNTFRDYDFVFVDDCIEAFELALFFRREDYAMFFIKKALINGFELKMLDQLNLGCPCNNYTEQSQRITVYQKFITKNKKALEKYSQDNYQKYLNRIDGSLLERVLRRHVREQLFKNYHSGLTGLIGVDEKEDMAEQNKLYKEICDDNLRFIDSLADHNIFLGERNLGLCTEKLVRSLHLSFSSTGDLLRKVLHSYHLPEETYVPINTEADYFEMTPLYNMLFHNNRSYSVLSQHKDAAIRTGFLHPREYESLKFNHNGFPKAEQLYLWPPYPPISDTASINARRTACLVPLIEVDKKKHEFAHQHNLKLLFGFNNGTK